MAETFWGEMWKAVQQGAAEGVQISQGRQAAHEWLNFRPDRVARSMETAVAEAVNTGQRAFLNGAFQQLLLAVQTASTREDQDDANELLWYFKVLVVQYTQTTGT
jgi:hypothetical protein